MSGSRYRLTDRGLRVAEEAARRRRDSHRKRGNLGHYTDDNWGEYDQEFFGNVGQMTMQRDMAEYGRTVFEQCSWAPLYVEDVSALPPWDCLIMGIPCEIKTTSPDTNVRRVRMLVKLSECKYSDVYFGFKMLNDDTCELCGFATREEVRRAPVENRGYGKAHEIRLDKLHPAVGGWWENFNPDSVNIRY